MGKWATYEKVKEDFEKLGLELVSTTFKRGKDYLEFVCQNHRELGIQKMTYENVKDRLKKEKYGCNKCIKNLNKICMTDSEYKNEVQKINPHIKIVGEYYDDMRYITYYDTTYDYKGRAYCKSLLKPFQSPIQKNGTENVIVGANDIKHCNPVLYEMLVDKSINEKYTINSRNKTTFRCLCCGGLIKNKTISHVHQKGIKCKCMDGNSLGEKYFYAVMQQVDSNIEFEKYLNENLSYRYDFYGEVNDKKWIVEIMGKQHNTKSFETCGGRTLEEEIENDRLKKEYALQCGINSYIYIDSKNSGYEELKKEILSSEITQLYDFSNVDWIMAYRNSLTSDVAKACELWNKGYKVMQIVDIMKIAKNTVRIYLTRGNEIGWCNYDHTKSNHTTIVCVNTKQVFKSQRDAERYYNLRRGYINNYLKGHRKMIIDGVEYKWMYYEDYIKIYGEEDLEECVS